jgi:hypothetical protein
MTYELMVPLKLLNITNHQNQPDDKLHLENREEIENRRGSHGTHQRWGDIIIFRWENGSI